MKSEFSNFLELYSFACATEILKLTICLTICLLIPLCESIILTGSDLTDWPSPFPWSWKCNFPNMFPQSSFVPEYSILNLQLGWRLLVWFWWCIFQIVLKQLTNTLFIFILVSTILKTGVNYYNTFLFISRKHPGNVLFLTKWCWCLPASTVSADYFHFRQMVHWQSRSNLKLCYQAFFTQRSNLNIGILLNFPGHSCLHLTSASFFFFFEQPVFCCFFPGNFKVEFCRAVLMSIESWSCILSKWYSNAHHTVGCEILFSTEPFKHQMPP